MEHLRSDRANARAEVDLLPDQNHGIPGFVAEMRIYRGSEQVSCYHYFSGVYPLAVAAMQDAYEYWYGWCNDRVRDAQAHPARTLLVRTDRAGCEITIDIVPEECHYWRYELHLLGPQLETLRLRSDRFLSYTKAVQAATTYLDLCHPVIAEEAPHDPNARPADPDSYPVRSYRRKRRHPGGV